MPYSIIAKDVVGRRDFITQIQFIWSEIAKLKRIIPTGIFKDDAFNPPGDVTIDGIFKTNNRANFNYLVGLVQGPNLTISGDAITVTHSYHALIPESGTTDGLDTIYGGRDGDILILKTADAAYTINVYEIGNIRRSIVVMNDQEDRLTLMYDDDIDLWCQIAWFAS